jgi:hypothetical protein
LDYFFVQSCHQFCCKETIEKQANQLSSADQPRGQPGRFGLAYFCAVLPSFLQGNG